jgi:hypothetical protein
MPCHWGSAYRRSLQAAEVVAACSKLYYRLQDKYHTLLGSANRLVPARVEIGRFLLICKVWLTGDSVSTR